jgi:hypothetical protein
MRTNPVLDRVDRFMFRSALGFFTIAIIGWISYTGALSAKVLEISWYIGAVAVWFVLPLIFVALYLIGELVHRIGGVL